MQVIQSLGWADNSPHQLRMGPLCSALLGIPHSWASCSKAGRRAGRQAVGLAGKMQRNPVASAVKGWVGTLRCHRAHVRGRERRGWSTCREAWLEHMHFPYRFFISAVSPSHSLISPGTKKSPLAVRRVANGSNSTWNQLGEEGC